MERVANARQGGGLHGQGERGGAGSGIGPEGEERDCHITIIRKSANFVLNTCFRREELS